MVTRGDDLDDFVRGSSTRLLRTAVLFTGDRAAAEDLVQEMYERVWYGVFLTYNLSSPTRRRTSRPSPAS